MEFRYLGNSGLKVSEITYGNWLTHGSQVENETALKCVAAALDAGITSFDTADVYANTAAEKVLGKALKGERRASLEIFTKVFWPIGPMGPNDSGLSRKHILESIDGSLKRLKTDYVDLYQAHRYDHETPLRGNDAGIRRCRAPGQGPLYRRLGVERRGASRGARARTGPRRAAHLQPAAVLRAVPGDRGEGRATSVQLGISQIVWSPIAQGVLTGKYLPGAPLPKDSRATDSKGGDSAMGQLMRDDVLEAVQGLKPIAAEAGLEMAQLAVAWVLQNPNVASAIIGASRPEQVTSNVKAAGVKLSPEIMEKIEVALAGVAVTDGSINASPAGRPSWKNNCDMSPKSGIF